MTLSKAHTGAVLFLCGAFWFTVWGGSAGTLWAWVVASEGKPTPRGGSLLRETPGHSPRLVVFLPNNHPNLQNGVRIAKGPFLTNSLRTK